MTADFGILAKSVITFVFARTETRLKGLMSRKYGHPSSSNTMNRNSRGAVSNPCAWCLGAPAHQAPDCAPLSEDVTPNPEPSPPAPRFGPISGACGMSTHNLAGGCLGALLDMVVVLQSSRSRLLQPRSSDTKQI